MKTFVVLGMHRSATSLVSKALSTQIYMGPNPRPNVFESSSFVKLNNAILARAGGSWHTPPDEAAILDQYDIFKREIARTIRVESVGKELWGWKDPRTTLTIRLYYRHLENPHFIVMFRDPVDVAKSLNIRDGFSIERGIRIAHIYNNRLLSFLQDCNLDYFGTI